MARDDNPDLWWGPHGPCRTADTLIHEVKGRLAEAIRRHGWCNEAPARAELGEEVWAAVERFEYGWAALCEASGVEGLAEAAERIGDHLWAVRVHGRRSLAEMASGNDDLLRDLSKLFGVPEPPPEQKVITGRDLALVLAHLLHGDIDMTPVAEAARIRIRLDVATNLTQELHRQWKENGALDKATFRRVLVRRLTDNQTMR